MKKISFKKKNATYIVEYESINYTILENIISDNIKNIDKCELCFENNRYTIKSTNPLLHKNAKNITKFMFLSN